MSGIYIERLRGVSREYEAAQQAVRYVLQHWYESSIFNDIPGLTPQHFKDTATQLERTYLIRLFAEFEGILKDHLDTNHSAARWHGKPRTEVRDKLEVNENITLIVREDNLRLVNGERQRLLDIRYYRNSIAHMNSTVPATITFSDALSRLNTFLAKFPNPIN